MKCTNKWGKGAKGTHEQGGRQTKGKNKRVGEGKLTPLSGGNEQNTRRGGKKNPLPWGDEQTNEHWGAWRTNKEDSHILRHQKSVFLELAGSQSLQ